MNLMTDSSTLTACDPFAKNYGVDKSGKTFDDPPEIFEEQGMLKFGWLKASC